MRRELWLSVSGDLTTDCGIQVDRYAGEEQISTLGAGKGRLATLLNKHLHFSITVGYGRHQRNHNMIVHAGGISCIYKASR